MSTDLQTRISRVSAINSACGRFLADMQGVVEQYLLALPAPAEEFDAQLCCRRTHDLVGHMTATLDLISQCMLQALVSTDSMTILRNWYTTEDQLGYFDRYLVEFISILKLEPHPGFSGRFALLAMPTVDSSIPAKVCAHCGRTEDVCPGCGGNMAPV
jgi:hypothetical protein